MMALLGWGACVVPLQFDKRFGVSNQERRDQKCCFSNRKRMYMGEISLGIDFYPIMHGLESWYNIN